VLTRGPQDVGGILKGGWCGWQSADLFIKSTFYNFCLPQRPCDV
jgi:hypothetical protein